MISQNRYLHFDNIDLQNPEISSRCSHCQQEFVADLKPGERVGDVLLRIRSEYEAHECLVSVR